MKTMITLCLLAGLALAVPAIAADPDGAAPGTPQPPPPASTNLTAPATPPAPEALTPPPAPEAAPAVAPATNGLAAPAPAPVAPVARSSFSTNGLMLNFRGVPLDMVLDFLSEAAGFIIVKEAQPRAKIEVWSSQPVTKEEAVDLLNTVLNRSGYAAIRKGRTLTIINRDEAKIRAIPVRSGSEPETIPDTDEIVTQIIPVRFVEVAQLIKDLQPLVSSQTAMTANESGNAIVITDAQSSIRRIAEVIKAIDTGAEDLTIVRVFRLQYANPTETAELLTSLFPEDTRSGSSQSPMAFGGGGGFRRFFGGGQGGGGSTGGGNQTQRIKKRNRVVAVADQRTGSLVVTAARDLMDQVEAVVTELDSNPANINSVAVMPLQNATPEEAMKVLQDLFQKSGTTSSRNTANQNSALQNRGLQQQQTTTTSGTGRSSTRGGTSFGGFGQ